MLKYIFLIGIMATPLYSQDMVGICNTLYDVNKQIVNIKYNIGASEEQVTEELNIILAYENMPSFIVEAINKNIELIYNTSDIVQARTVIFKNKELCLESIDK